ncbi:methylamine utilization protein MauJ [Chthonobacter rhizosphaerae]|uniref:methylamine utilization protein MauJ n=1 Tax=Chthonobacter rhizosphaerae TaxID=2735553 RepID=UPI0015EF770F|nr:methylamine utilization protein MauJ [Chthonobacter rhizosphaerae]
MWIPYGLSEAAKPESEPAVVQASRDDRTMRDILVGFTVRNPVTQAYEIDVALATASPVTSDSVGGLPAEISFHGVDGGAKVSEIVYRAKGVDPFAVLHDCRKDLEDRLGRWSVQLGRGMAVAGWRLADPKNRARWRCTPFRPSALALEMTRADQAPAAFAGVLDLYRRARNATDPAWRLLLATAVLDLWRAGRQPFAPADRDAEHKVTFDMLIYSNALSTAADLQDQPFAALLARLDGRRATVLSVLDGGADPAALAADDGLSPMADLADLAARHVLLAALAARAHEGEFA